MTYWKTDKVELDVVWNMLNGGKYFFFVWICFLKPAFKQWLSMATTSCENAFFFAVGFFTISSVWIVISQESFKINS